MEYLWEVALMIVMYTCAIFYYPERLLKSGYSWVLTVNPVYNVIINVRNIIFHEAELDIGDVFKHDTFPP